MESLLQDSASAVTPASSAVISASCSEGSILRAYSNANDCSREPTTGPSDWLA